MRLEFIGEEGDIFSVDMRKEPKEWRTGRLENGIKPSDMTSSSKPENDWLTKFTEGSGLIVFDDTKAIPAPPYGQLPDNKKVLPTLPGERERMIQAAVDHLEVVELEKEKVYSGCQHQKIIEVGAHVVANLANIR